MFKTPVYVYKYINDDNGYAGMMWSYEAIPNYNLHSVFYSVDEAIEYITEWFNRE